MSTQALPPIFLIRAVTTLTDWLARARRAVLPTPVTLFEMTTMAYFVSNAITSASKLAIPEALKEGPLTCAEIARAIGANESSVHRLMRALASVGFFDLKGDRYRLNALSRRMLPDEPGSVLPMMRLASEDWVRSLWGHLAEAVRSGKSPTSAVLGMPLFEYLAQTPAASDVFNRAMVTMTAQTTAAVLAAYDLSSTRNLVDVGGGLGQFVMAAVSRYSQLRATLFEMAHLEEAAAKRIADAGYRDRIDIVAGDFFKDPLPFAADLYVLMNILHDWSDAEAVRILGRVRDALRPDARLLVIEMVLPEDGKLSIASVLDLQMLLLFDGGRERTVAEFHALFAEAGLRMVRMLGTASASSVMVLARA
ncbi:MAG TPA: methyltransferase [Polyangiaceae bacterium]|nr:methyltransferase [Polyangiaceae bacterium]